MQPEFAKLQQCKQPRVGVDPVLCFCRRGLFSRGNGHIAVAIDQRERSSYVDFERGMILQFFGYMLQQCYTWQQDILAGSAHESMRFTDNVFSVNTT